jgi:mannitol 2-dehydrogenase
MRDALAAQDHLYTLVAKHPDGTWDGRVVGSVIDYLFAPDDPEAVVERMADPGTRIVSLTITEGGYHVPPSTAPLSVFGLVTEALVRRRSRGVAPFAVMSCDNVQANGRVARQSFGAFASQRDEDLGRWVQGTVPFPSSMVDRITPVTTDDDRREISRRLGVEDRWPVVCEPFRQWVLEDAFADRPPLEDVGVTLVGAVEPYEVMKLRLLNGSHQALAYFGYLAGYRLVHDVCRDPVFAALVRDYMHLEATPTLDPVPGVDLDTYRAEVLTRFSNDQVRDTVARLCAETSDRIPTFLLPVIRHNLATGGPIDRSAAVVASWARYAERVDEQGQPIEVVDRLAGRLQAAARAERVTPLSFLRDREVFGDLADQPRFASAYLAALRSLHDRGARETLAALAARPAAG